MVDITVANSPAKNSPEAVPGCTVFMEPQWGQLMLAAWNQDYWWAETDYYDDEKLLRWMPWRSFLPHARRRELRPETDYTYPILAEAVKDIIENGGHGAIGAHGQAHGIGPHWEVWMAFQLN